MTENQDTKARRFTTEKWGEISRITAAKQDLVFAGSAFILNVSGLAASAVSLKKGYDVRYTQNARPMTALRSVERVAFGSAAVLNASLLATQVLLRRRPNEKREVYGYAARDPQDLSALAVSSLITAAMSTKELVTGCSLVTKSPLSTYSKVISAARILQSAYVVTQTGKQLYTRREEWSPELQTTIFLLMHDFKTFRYNTLTKLGVKRSDESRRDEGARRLLVDVMKTNATE